MKTKLTTIALAALITAGLLFGMTVNGSLDILGTLTAAVVNFGSSTSTTPNKVGTSLPSSCSVGQTFFKSDAVAGQNMYLATSASPCTWTAISSGSSGGWDPTDVTKLLIVEEFPNGNSSSHAIGTNGWASATLASGAVDDNSTPIAGLPGYVAGQAHGTNVDSGAILTLLYSDASTVTGNDWVWQARAKLYSTSNSRTWIGVGLSAPAITPARFIGFRYDTSSGFADDTKNTTGRWVTQMCVSSNCTDTGGTYVVTSVQPNTSFHLYEIAKVSGTYTFKIDGTQVSTFCASGCDTTVTSMNSYVNFGFFSLGFESGAGFAYTYVDRWYFAMSGLSR